MNKKLKDKEALEWSSVVANNSMNRKRIAFGVNSYEKEIKLDPIKYLISKYTDRKLSWLDLCCGEGNALIQSAKFIKENKHENKIGLEGIDLVSYFSEYSGYEDILQLEEKNLENWIPTKKYDLITCVHGLHYIGNKIGLLEKISTTLTGEGKFIGNFSLENIRIQGVENSEKMLRKIFKESGLTYNARTKIIKLTEPISIASMFKYLGADDQVGPNYTGQSVVDSIYEYVGPRKH